VTTTKEKRMTAAVKEKPKVELEQRIVVPDQPYSKRDAPAVQRPEATSLVQALATAAANPSTDMDKMERLFAMHQTMVKQQAEAQSKIQPVAARSYNDQTKSKYAKLAEIAREITPLITAEGLSLSYDAYTPEFDKDGKEINPPPKDWHRTVAIVSHREGHSRKYHLDLPLDDVGAKGTVNKTGVHAMGSTTSYARRYLACMIFNVATFDDNDGNGTGNGKGQGMDEKVLADHLAAIEAAANEQEILKAFGKAWNAAETIKDKDAQRQLMAQRDARRKALRPGGAR
jgi:hypothetical protein